MGTGEPIDTFWVEMSRKTGPLVDAAGPPNYLRHLHEYVISPWHEDPRIGKLHKELKKPLTIERISRETWFVTVRSPGYVRSSRAIAIDGAEAVLKFPLKPAIARLRGSLIDSVTSKPIAAAKVWLAYEVDGDTSLTRTDRDALVTGKDGRFLFEELPGAGYSTEVSIAHDGFFNAKRLLRATEDWKEDLGDIPLTPYSSISGRVVDAAGRPVKGQMVYVMPADLDHTEQETVVSFVYGMQKRTGKPGKIWRVNTDADGRFETFDTDAPWSPVTPPMRAGTYRVVFGDPEREQKVVKVAVGEKKFIALKKAADR